MERRPLVQVSGGLAELPAVDTLPAAEPGVSRAAGARTPGQRDPATAAPTITVSGTLAASTPTLRQAILGTAAVNGRTGSLNPEFAFRGGPYQRAFTASPWQEAVRERPRPAFAIGVGETVVEWTTDAPALSLQLFTNSVGYMRLLADGVEVAHLGAPLTAGTAQAGAAATITLATASSAVNSFYATRWVRITGGTGAGQRRQIASYVGSTRVATVGQAWTTQPDSSSTYEVAAHRLDGSPTTSTQYALIDWAGERRFRRYRIEVSNDFFRGIYTAAQDTVAPVAPTLGTPTIWAGDSIAFGTGGHGTVIDSSSAQACRQLGWSLIPEAAIPGTGWLNTGVGTSATLRDRLLPPYNSWVVHLSGTAGTYTLTWGGATTAAIAYNAVQATIQAAVDAAFGAGVFQVTANNGGFNHLILFGRGATKDSALPLTADFTAMTGGWRQVERWTGTVAPHIPRDGADNPLPFNIVLAAGGNDRPVLNAAYTAAALYAEARQLILDLGAAYPTARLLVVGPHNTVNPPYAETIAAMRAIRQACQEVLPPIRGAVPLVEPITEAAGTTLASAASAAATSISTVASVPVGTHIAIDTGTATETRTVTAVSGSGPYTLTVAALTGAHASGAGVAPVAAWITGSGYLGGQTGSGTADLLINTDGVHPNPLGSQLIGTRVALGFDAILTRQLPAT